jgi:hypothetical protein
MREAVGGVAALPSAMPLAVETLTSYGCRQWGGHAAPAHKGRRSHVG